MDGNTVVSAHSPGPANRACGLDENGCHDLHELTKRSTDTQLRHFRTLCVRARQQLSPTFASCRRGGRQGWADKGSM